MNDKDLTFDIGKRTWKALELVFLSALRGPGQGVSVSKGKGGRERIETWHTKLAV